MENISDLDRFESEVVNVRGVDWKLIVERNGDFVGVYLYANHEIISGEPNVLRQIDTYDVEATFELLSADTSVTPLKKSFNPQDYRPSYFYWGYGATKGVENFIKFNELMDPNNKFVQNNKATFIVEFSVGASIGFFERPDRNIAYF